MEDSGKPKLQSLPPDLATLRAEDKPDLKLTCHPICITKAGQRNERGKEATTDKGHARLETIVPIIWSPG
jgi:hypothetical protein